VAGNGRETICVTVLVENSVTGRGLRAEHGLAYHIQAGRHALLFDTGQSDLLGANARELGLRLEELEGIALSHGHYDHTGGIGVVRSMAPQARVYLHPAAVAPKYAGNPDGTSRAVGMTHTAAQAIQQAGEKVVWTTRPTELMDGIFLTGEIPRESPFEDNGGAFFLDADCARRDPLADDQALYFDTRSGVVVLLGCAHAGVVNTLHTIRAITGGRPIHAVIGGMHLLGASADRVERTLACFRELQIQRLGPAHCTGALPTARLRTEFTGECVQCVVGSSLVFQR
jgi:7,8-dihydropterin-6-yl-methyl-4-(beta-D-ribofuranosyl)aminobenzene 5'-phosphate synthase